MVTSSSALLPITLYYQFWPVYYVYDYFYATEHNLSVSPFRYIWTLFLLLNTFWLEWSSLLTPRNKLLYIISFNVYTVSKTLFDGT
jgi:hypothetical protein